MADWVGIKYAMNSTLGTTYFRPLDQIVSAVMILEGASGTKFDVTNLTINETFSITLWSGESRVGVPVPLGTYKIVVTFNGKTTTVNNFVIDALGMAYKVTYAIQLAQITSTPSTFTVPSGLTSILVDAAGGGGGGGGGGMGNKSGTAGLYGSGGGGGGGAAQAVKRKLSVSSGEVINITLGLGGTGGLAGGTTGTSGGTGGNGTSGTATVIGSKLTLAGGSFGYGGKPYGNAGGAGGSGASGGYSGKSGTAGATDSAGTGGTGGEYGGGKGGNGGSGTGKAGANGSNGYVRIYMGVA